MNEATAKAVKFMPVVGQVLITEVNHDRSRKPWNVSQQSRLSGHKLDPIVP